MKGSEARVFVHRIVLERTERGEEVIQPEINEAFQLREFGVVRQGIREGAVIEASTWLAKNGSIHREWVTREGHRCYRLSHLAGCHFLGCNPDAPTKAG